MKEQISTIYRNRFSDDFNKREKVWQWLVQYYFQKYVPLESVVCEIAAGYCHFINNIKATAKIAVDINPDVKKFAADDVKTIVSSASHIRGINKNSVDVIFISNFFEHIPKDEIIKVLQSANSLLKENGKIIILQPNIKYAYKEYWSFFDHITPLDEESLVEVLTLCHFNILKVKSRFLPYSMKSKLPKWKILIYVFLKLEFAQRMFGKQALVIAEKSRI